MGKSLLFFLFFFVIGGASLYAQDIQFNDNCGNQFTLSLNGTVDGKNSYRYVDNPSYSVYLRFNATNNRWEMLDSDNELWFFNTNVTSVNPPSKSYAGLTNGGWQRGPTNSCSLIDLGGTGTVSSANQAPTAIALSAASINENAAAGSTVGTLSTTDPDASNTFTYTLVSGTGSTDNASFTIDGTSLKLTPSPNFETKSSYSVRIRSTDQGSLYFEKEFTVSVTNVNETPTAIALSASSINENVAAGSTVGTLSTTDPDASNTFTYTLVTGTGSTDNASFTIDGTSLKLTPSPDYETKSSYLVRIRSTDQGSLYYEKEFTVSINNVNEAPTTIALSASSINENVAAGSTVGTLSTTDPDASNTFTYTLVTGTGSTDNTSFTIDGTSLKLTPSPDYETKSSYLVRIRSTDQGSLYYEKEFTVSINNVNEAPTAIALGAASINENADAGSTVGTLSTTDPDASNTFTYTLVTGTGSTDNASFTIDGTSLKLTPSPDFETKSSYLVRIRTTDQGNLYYEKEFTVSINNVNEAPTAIALSASSINENVAAGSTVGTLSTTDPDASNTFTYTLVTGTGSTDNSAFSISGNELVLTASPDYETKSNYSVRIRTTDQGSLYYEKEFTVSINNVNEAPTAIALSASSINENVAAGSTVGTLSTTDPDASNTFTYALVTGTGSTDNASFTIDGTSLKLTPSPDFETKSTYLVRIRSTDQGNLYYDKEFTVSINNVNEAPTAIALSASSINENESSGSTIGTLSTTDPDASNTFTYTLVTGTGSTDNASFTIDGTSLKLTPSPDFETKSSYSVRIRSTDQGSLYYEKEFTVSINNVNEAPTAIALSTSSINENASAGSTVGTLSTTDPDASNTFTYTLVTGIGSTDNASFTIDETSLKLTPSPDFETKSSYLVRIRSTDQGSLYYEKEFTVSINNVNEAPTAIALSAASINENATAGSTVGTLSTTDPDASNTFTYALVTGTGSTDNASFTIDGTSLKLTPSPDFETKSTYLVRIRSTDQGNLYYDKEFTVSINNVNEAPTAIALSASSINENESSGSTIGTLSTTDPDASNTFTYTLVTGTGSTDNASFTIDGTSLKLTPSPDFETKSSYLVRIRSTDQGSLYYEKEFTVSINNVNEVPTAIALSASSINENVAAGSTVGTLSTTDPDASNTFTYALVTGTGSTDNAAFIISGDALVLTDIPDFEAKSSYLIRIRTTGQGSLYYDKEFTVSINNVNEASTAIALSASSINENAAAGSTVGILSTTDPDASNTFTYTLVTGTGSTDNTSFTIDGTSLKLTPSPDYETKSSYLVRVRTTDQGNLYYEKEFTISVTNVNESPTAIALSASSINENVAAGSTVGTLSTTDPDASNTFTYTLVTGTGSTDNASFTIDGTSLKLTPSPDYETKSSYLVRIRTADQGSLYYEKEFTVSINNVNEAPTAIALSASSINENAAAGSTVGTLSTTDPDASNTFTYALVTGTGSTDNAAFTISGDALVLTYIPDFEAKSSYLIRIRTTDQGNLYYEKEFTVSINNVNESPTAIALSASSINENVAAGSTVGTLSTTDPDASNTFTYTLVTGTGSTDNASFTIDGTSLKLTPSPDFETKSSYSVRIRSTDQGSLYFEKEFTVSINNVNESPTAIALSASSINENVAAGSTVGTLSTTDPDASNTFTYTLVTGTGSTDNASFTIDGTSLKLTPSPDFETKSSYSVRIRTTDQGSLYYEKEFTVSINNVNEAPTAIALSASSINENAAAGSTIGTLSTTDPDASNTFTYTLVTGTGSTDNSAFSISDNELVLTASPDFETKSSYLVRIRTIDQGSLYYEKEFTVSINNVNEAPTAIALSASSINENVAAGSTVGTLSTTDPDASNTFTYTLVTGTGSTDNSAFSISGNELVLTASPDFETKSSYLVRIRTTDQGNLYYEKEFTVSINNVNEAPTAITLSASSINENVAAGSTAGTLSATDPDASNTFIYTLVTGTGSTDNSAFSISGNELVLTASPDFETKSSYLVRIRTTDQGNLYYEKEFTISVTNVNESPTAIALSASSINENVAAGSTVGTLSTTDPDASNTFTYTLVTGTGSTDNASFTIDGTSLKLAPSPDYETKSSYLVRIRTVDQGSLYYEKEFTVSINNVNEAPTAIALSASSINENAAAGSTVGTLSTTDPDASNTFTYTLVTGTGSTDNASFTIDGTSLKLTPSPDYETKSSYLVRIRSTDQSSLYFEKEFTVSINNVNEAPTAIALSASSINENAAAGSTVGTLSTTDSDASNTFTYALVTGTGSTDNASFTIDGISLKLTPSPDFETKSSYSVRIRTTDQGSLYYDKEFTVSINNVNEAPTAIALSAASINENAAAGSTVGTLSTTDPDASNTFTYTLVTGTGSTDNAAFTISGDALVLTYIPDYEVKSSYSVRIRSTDQGNLYYEKEFTVSVTNVNEAPTAIALSALSINENVAAGSTVGTLSTTDPDASNTFTYTLVTGTGSTDNTSFTIDGTSLKLTPSPDFETKSSYSIRIRTTDQGSLYYEKEFTISITNVNESPTAIALSASSINENAAAGSTIGTLSTTDPDASNTFTYTLVTGTGSTDNASFTIDGTSLKLTPSPDFETTGSYSVRIRTTDQGSLYYEKEFTVSITNVNEAPTAIALSASSINENAAAGSTVGTLSTTDPDASNTFTYTLVTGTGSTDNASFTIDGTSLKLTPSLDFETKGSYLVRIRTTDQGSLYYEKEFTVSITNVNETPRAIALSAASISENAAAGSIVGTLSTTDPDASNTFTYTLVTGTGSTDNAAFTIDGTSLKLTPSPDFETKGSYSVRIRTTDQGSLYYEKEFTVSVTNVNEAPTAIALSASSISENTAAGSTVGALSTTDSDASNTFTYTLVTGTGSTDNAAFTIDGTSLKLTPSPDFETTGSYSIRIRTTDQGSLYYEKEFTVSITNVNEAPTAIALSASSISENTAAGSTVGALSTTDSDASNTFTYTLVTGTGSTDNAAFTIDGTSLKLTPSPDFETTGSYSVRIRTTDQGSLYYEKEFTVSITNVNEAPTAIALSASSINENAAAGSTVGTLSTTDPDASNMFTYTLVTGTGSTDNASFTIDGTSLKLTPSPDFETKGSYSVRIRTTDQGSLYYEKEFTVSINNVNEAPIAIALSASAINENAAAGSTVGTLSTTDSDASNTFTYTLVTGTGSTDNASFTIDGTSLKLTPSPDYETKSSYSVRIRSTDQGNLYYEKEFTVSINNVNEAPTAIALSASSINENVAAGSTVGTLSTTDPDASNTFTYTLVTGTGSTNNASFTIDGTSLKLTPSPDYEVKSSYSVRIRSTDQGSLYYEKEFTVSVTNVNEAPTAIALSAASISENAAAGSTVGTLSTTDSDASNTFTYTLVTGTGNTDNAAFTISGDALVLTNIPDFEAKSSYLIRIRTTDQGSLYYEKEFTVSVTNVNEAPTAIALSASSINENAAAGSTIGTLSTTDPDASNTFTYTLVTGIGSTDNASFTIDGTSLKLTPSPDFETKSSYSVRIRTTDQGSLYYEKEFAVSVTNVNEAPTAIALSASSINENVAAGSTIGTLSTIDPDAPNTFTYTLVSGAGSTDNASFTIDGTGLKLTSIPDFEIKNSYSVRIRTIDQGGLSLEKQFMVSVNNVNEQPTGLILSALSMHENAAAGSTVGTLNTTDPDASGTFTYTLVRGTGSADNNMFIISGNILKINTITDFEVKNSYNIRIRSTDQGGLTYDDVFSISINDINERPTELILSALTINENVLANSAIGLLSTTDPDAANTFTYALVTGTGSTDNVAFTISGDALKLTAIPDFEIKSNYSIRIRTTDQGGLDYEKSFTIHVNDLYEDIIPPAITSVSVPANGTYLAGTALTFKVYFTENVAINGHEETAFIPVTIGNTARRAYFKSGNGTDQFVFDYVVQANDNDQDGIELGNHIISDQSFFQDAAGNNAVLIFNAVPSTESIRIGVPPVPIIHVAGTLVSLSTVYGLASSLTSFNVSGEDMDAGILVTAPEGFEISLNQTTFAGNITIGSAGTIGLTPVYLRLKATVDAGIYAGDIILSSLKAVSIHVSADANNQVLKKGLNITANSRSKTYGNRIDFSGTEFIADGLVNGNTVTSVNLNSAGALEAAPVDASGYVIIPSAAIGLGLESYTVNYTNGLITVNPKALIIAADDKQRAVGMPDPVWTATYSGFVNGENADVLLVKPLFLTTASQLSPQGSYPITVGRTNAKNYSISYVDGVLTITPGILTNISFAQSNIYENHEPGALAGVFNSTASDPGATFSYSLVAGSGDTDNGSFTISGNELKTAVVFNYEQKANYNIRIRSANQYGQMFEQSFTVALNDVNEPPTLDAIADQAVCASFEKQSVSLSGLGAGPEAGQRTTFTISSTDASLFDDLQVSNSGLFSYRPAQGKSGTAIVTITIRDNGGTEHGGIDSFSRNFTVTINPMPVAVIAALGGKVELSKGETLILTANGGSGYIWENTPGIVGARNTASITIRPDVTTTYRVSVSSATGCVSTKEITILVKEDFIMVKGTNILTPNGDGKNDRFKLRNIDMYPNNEVIIFDRAGRKLYSKVNYTDEWDGTFQGSPLAEDTYYYIVDFGFGKMKLKGFVTIVRD